MLARRATTTRWVKARAALSVRVAIAVGSVVFLLLAGTGLASAVWLVTAPTSGTVSAATVSFTAVGSGSLAGEYKFAGAAPGGAKVRSVVLTNTGQSPLIYSLAKSQPAAFTDVTTGTNALFGGSCCPARAGFDLATGWGSPRANVIAQLLATRR